MIDAAYDYDLDFDEAFYLSDYKGVYTPDLDQEYSAEDLEDDVYSIWGWDPSRDLARTLGKMLMPPKGWKKNEGFRKIGKEWGARIPNPSEVLLSNGRYNIIKDGYGFGVDNGTTVNRFIIDNDGTPKFDGAPTKEVRNAVYRLIKQGKFNNPHYKGDDAYYVANTLKYHTGIKEARGNYGHKPPFWYFTLHGVGPGTKPADINYLASIDGENEKAHKALLWLLTVFLQQTN